MTDWMLPAVSELAVKRFEETAKSPSRRTSPKDFKIEQEILFQLGQSGMIPPKTIDFLF